MRSIKMRERNRHADAGRANVLIVPDVVAVLDAGSSDILA